MNTTSDLASVATLENLLQAHALLEQVVQGDDASMVRILQPLTAALKLHQRYAEVEPLLARLLGMRESGADHPGLPEKLSLVSDLADVLEQLGKFDQAVAYRRDLLTLTGSREAHTKLIHSLRSARRYDEAIEAAKASAQAFPPENDINILATSWLVASLHRDAGRLAVAIAVFETALDKVKEETTGAVLITFLDQFSTLLVQAGETGKNGIVRNRRSRLARQHNF